MLYKYLGIDRDSGKIRNSFIEDGCFRFTQPKYLDDPQEGIPKFYLHEYSPKDIERARSKLLKSPGIMADGEISDELVILLQLRRFPPLRLGDVFPHILKESGFSSMKERDEAFLKDISDQFQKQLNEDRGILSLSTENDNQELWSKYSEDYQGMIVGISEDFKFAENTISDQVIYDKESVNLHFSLVDGVVRIDGTAIDELDDGKLNMSDEIIRSFLFHKKKTWSHQNEFRIISKLRHCIKVNEEVYLKQIDFKYIREIIFGNHMKEEEIEDSICKVKSNHKLEHLRFFRQKFDSLTREITIEPLQNTKFQQCA